MNNIAKIRKTRDRIEAAAEKGPDRPELLDSVEVLKNQFKVAANRKKGSDKVLLELLKKTIILSYLNGNNARVKTEDGYYIFVPNEVHFDVICPCCNAGLELDLKDMLKADEIIEGEI